MINKCQKKDRVSSQKRKLLDQAATAPKQKKLNSFFVAQAAQQVEVADALQPDSIVNTSSHIDNNQSHSSPVAREEFDNAAIVREDVNINSCSQEAIKVEPNASKRNSFNSATQEVEWSDWIRTEEEFTWTIR